MNIFAKGKRKKNGALKSKRKLGKELLTNPSTSGVFVFYICYVFYVFCIYIYTYTYIHEQLWVVNIKLENHGTYIYFENSVFNIYLLVRYSCEIFNKKKICED